MCRSVTDCSRELSGSEAVVVTDVVTEIVRVSNDDAIEVNTNVSSRDRGSKSTGDPSCSSCWDILVLEVLVCDI